MTPKWSRQYWNELILWAPRVGFQILCIWGCRFRFRWTATLRGIFLRLARIWRSGLPRWIFFGLEASLGWWGYSWWGTALSSWFCSLAEWSSSFEFRRRLRGWFAPSCRCLGCSLRSWNSCWISSFRAVPLSPGRLVCSWGWDWRKHLKIMTKYSRFFQRCCSRAWRSSWRSWAALGSTPAGRCSTNPDFQTPQSPKTADTRRRTGKCRCNCLSLTLRLIYLTKTSASSCSSTPRPRILSQRTPETQCQSGNSRTF